MFHLKGLTFLNLIFKTCLLILILSEVEGLTEDDYQVSKPECLNAGNFTFVVKTCCQPLDMSDAAASNCIQTKMTNMPEDKVEKLQKLAILVECIYKKRKYIKSDNQLNMGAIKAQANKLYNKDSVKKDHLINMYRFCARSATKTINTVSAQPDGKQLIQNTHQPYALFVFLCGFDYSTSKCPYFLWEGTNELNARNCAKYANQCKKLFKNSIRHVNSLKHNSNS